MGKGGRDTTEAYSLQDSANRRSRDINERAFSSSLSCLANIASNAFSDSFTACEELPRITPTAVNALSSSVPFISYDDSGTFTFEQEEWDTPKKPTLHIQHQLSNTVSQDALITERANEENKDVSQSRSKYLVKSSENEPLDKSSSHKKSKRSKKTTRIRASDLGVSNEAALGARNHRVQARRASLTTSRRGSSRSRSRGRARNSNPSDEVTQSNASNHRPRSRGRRQSLRHTSESADHVRNGCERNDDTNENGSKRSLSKRGRQGIRRRGRSSDDIAPSSPVKPSKSYDGSQALESSTSDPSCSPFPGKSRPKLRSSFSSPVLQTDDMGSPRHGRKMIGSIDLLKEHAQLPVSPKRSTKSMSTSHACRNHAATSSTKPRALSCQNDGGDGKLVRSVIRTQSEEEVDLKLMIAGITAEQYKRLTEMGLIVRKDKSKRAMV